MSPLTCPGPTCPLCSGAACTACSTGDPRIPCDHNVYERHARVGVKLDGDAEVTVIDVDALEDEPLVNRTPTRPLPSRYHARLEAEVAPGEAADALACFLETVARLVRDHGCVVLTAEAPRNA